MSVFSSTTAATHAFRLLNSDAWLNFYAYCRHLLAAQYGVFTVDLSHDCDSALTRKQHMHFVVPIKGYPGHYMCVLSGMVHACIQGNAFFLNDATCPYVTEDQHHSVSCVLSGCQQLFTYGGNDLASKRKDKRDAGQRTFSSDYRNQNNSYMKKRVAVLKSSNSGNEFGRDLMRSCTISSGLSLPYLYENEEEMRMDQISKQKLANEMFGFDADDPPAARVPESTQNIKTSMLSSSSFLSNIVSAMTVESSVLSGEGYHTIPSAPPFFFRSAAETVEQFWQRIPAHERGNSAAHIAFTFESIWTYEPEDHNRYYDSEHMLRHTDIERTAFSSKIPYASSCMKAFCAVHYVVPEDYYWSQHNTETCINQEGDAGISACRTSDNAAYRYGVLLDECLRTSKSRKCVSLAVSSHQTLEMLSPSVEETSNDLASFENTNSNNKSTAAASMDSVFVAIHRDVNLRNVSGINYLEKDIFDKVFQVFEAPPFFTSLDRTPGFESLVMSVVAEFFQQIQYLYYMENKHGTSANALGRLIRSAKTSINRALSFMDTEVRSTPPKKYTSSFQRLEFDLFGSTFIQKGSFHHPSLLQVLTLLATVVSSTTASNLCESNKYHALFQFVDQMRQAFGLIATARAVEAFSVESSNSINVVHPLAYLGTTRAMFSLLSLDTSRT